MPFSASAMAVSTFSVSRIIFGSKPMRRIYWSTMERTLFPRRSRMKGNLAKSEISSSRRHSLLTASRQAP